ncbi:IS66 family transposase [Thiolapillus sp.]|uniref:IS66 family transposase n=15 Tax=Thiolapillus sp. TaxID=2017437 RepID=UPI0025FA824A|nr:IS66 family transposase [Thiolapillus sp.]
MKQGIESTKNALPPDHPEVLELVEKNARLANEKAALELNYQQLQAKYAALLEQIRLFQHQRFGASSEKFHPDQQDLFNEAEATAEEIPIEEVDDALSAPEGASSARKRGRKALPPELPRIEVIHDLPEEQRHCPEGHELKVIGEEVSEQLDIIPAKIQVIRHIRKKYACPCCEAHVKTAAAPEQPIPKSNASPGLLAWIVTSKFLDALPLYRQSGMLQRIGITIARGTLAAWVIRCGELIQPLINLLREQLLLYDIQQMDETTIQVLKETGKKAQSKSYIWVQRGGPPGRQVLLFTYDSSRGQHVADALLADYQGYLQTDGYGGYDPVCANNELIQVGCFAHARRKFDEALKAQGKGRAIKAGKASKGLIYIQKLYRIEKQIKDLEPEERYQERQQQAVPLFDEIRTWLDKSLPQVPPTSLTGKALYYLDNQWDKLICYCKDGRLEIDNNATERTIRPFVIGRNNWLFADTVEGARASGNLYSLIETVKAHDLEPYRYLRHVFKELPRAQSLEEIEQLLPWHVDKEQINNGWAKKVDGV